MRTSKFTDAQIVVVLQNTERSGRTDEVSRRHGIAQDTSY